MLELILFAGLAAVVLFQLYAVLGRRYGDAPPTQPVQTLPASAHTTERQKPAPSEVKDGVGIAAVKAADPRFEVGKFLKGARKAYEMIVVAHAKGDIETLKPLLNADVLAAFESDIADRHAAGTTEPIEFVSAPRGEIEDARIEAGIVRIAVRLSAEIRVASNPDAEAERTDELWTFERPVAATGPNWTLSQVSEPAQPEV